MLFRLSIMYLFVIFLYNWKHICRLYCTSCNKSIWKIQFGVTFSKDLKYCFIKTYIRWLLTHLPARFSLPAYLMTRIRPERVPRKAVSMPSSTLQHDKGKERDIMNTQHWIPHTMFSKWKRFKMTFNRKCPSLGYCLMHNIYRLN